MTRKDGTPCAQCIEDATQGKKREGRKQRRGLDAAFTRIPIAGMPTPQGGHSIVVCMPQATKILCIPATWVQVAKGVISQNRMPVPGENSIVVYEASVASTHLLDNV